MLFGDCGLAGICFPSIVECLPASLMQLEQFGGHFLFTTTVDHALHEAMRIQPYKAV